MSREIGSRRAQEVLRGRNSSGINNVGLMARALALKDNPGLDEEENVKWQTLQVSTLSIASCAGRILIGIFFSRGTALTRLNLPDRCDSGLCKSQRDETCLVSLCSRRIFPHFSVGGP